MTALADQHCQPVQKGEHPLPASDIEKLSREIPRWEHTNHAIEREFRFAGFQQAMAFVSSMAETAMQEDHHPDICISFDKVRLTLSTHKVGGLTRNDFILAAKSDRQYGQ